MRPVQAHALELQHIECHTGHTNDGSLGFGLTVIPWGAYPRTCFSFLHVVSFIDRYFSPTTLLVMTGCTGSLQSVLTGIGKILIVD
jgi:hypothetical protein